MYLVTGATGNVGKEVVAALLAANEPVRALVRDPGQRVPEGVEPVVGDLNKPESMRDALAGVRGVFLLPGYEDMPGLLDQVREAQVDRVVLLSSGSAEGGDLNNAIARFMILSERAVTDSGVPWTILRPGAFMSNTLRWLDQLRAGDEVRVPFPDVAAALIDPYDIAAVAAKALVSDEHLGRIYSLTGGEALLPAEQLAVLADVLDRPLRCIGMSNEETRADMEAKMPIEYVDAFFNFYAEGALDESQVTPTVEQLTGRAPRTLGQWARAHAHEFAQ